MATRIKIISLILLFCNVLSHAQVQKQDPLSIKVAQDGSGDFKSIQEAVNSVQDLSAQRVEIHIKNGIYREKLVIPSWKVHISLVGEEAEKTIITNSDYSGKNGINTYTSYTVLVQGNDFKASNLTFENAAGPVGQAVALHVEADRVFIRNCRILGNQDTLFPASDSSRQYYLNCYIEGTTDFIFGAATAVFDHCRIHSKKNSYITAASTAAGRNYGFVFLDCTLTADPAFKKVYLGRPWRPYANTVFIRTSMGDHILPQGWHTWNDNENHKNSFYAEYGSYGPGFVKEARVAWSRQLSSKEAKKYTLQNIFSGPGAWLPL